MTTKFLIDDTDGSFIRVEDGARIPADPANMDYQEVKQMLESGEPIFAPLPEELDDAGPH